jgi:hypothetical protein
MSGGPVALQPFAMRVNRLGLVPVSSSHPGVRRYRLARLEEAALETPPARTFRTLSPLCGLKVWNVRLSPSPERSQARTPPPPNER